MLLLSQPIPANLSKLDMVAVKESIRHSEIIPIPQAKAMLIASGIADADGRIATDDLLADMLTLAEAPSDEGSVFANSLSPENRLRRFYDHVIMDKSENARILIECISQRIQLPLTSSKKNDLESFESQLLEAFQKLGDFSNGRLSGPSLSSAPHRILWTYRDDISDGFEKFYSQEDLEHKRTYELVANGRFEELAKSHAPGSIPAFKAWHRMSNFKSPPLIKSHIFLHLGKRTLRFSLYCTTTKRSNSPSLLLRAITKAFENSLASLCDGWVFAGPPTHSNLSLSKSIQKDLSDLSKYTDFTRNSAEELFLFLEKTLKSSSANLSASDLHF